MKIQTLLILLLISMFLGCDQGQKIMQPVAQDILVEEPSVAFVEIPPVQDIEVKDLDTTYTIKAFTTAQAAFESEQFQEFLEYAREYNSKWCGQLEIEETNINNLFEFTNQLAALEFLSKAHTMYPDDIKDRTTETQHSLRDATDNIPSWGIRLHSRCE